MLLYFDDVLGRLFEAVANSGLADSTYILLTADNGPGLSRALLTDKMQRLVSGVGGWLSCLWCVLT
jgi:arylsulfatase A-like enzyme